MTFNVIQDIMGYQLESLLTAEALECFCENTLVFCLTKLKYIYSASSGMQPLIVCLLPLDTVQIFLEFNVLGDL